MKCNSLKKNGTPCGNSALKGMPFCSQHVYKAPHIVASDSRVAQLGKQLSFDFEAQGEKPSRITSDILPDSLPRYVLFRGKKARVLEYEAGRFTILDHEDERRFVRREQITFMNNPSKDTPLPQPQSVKETNPERVKYPRTHHLPFSPGKTSDDKVMSADVYERFKALDNFVVTEKMDGGNLTMSQNHFFARSLDSGSQPWDSAAKSIWSTIRYQIPEGWRISGESVYARRSVSYEDLPGVYMVFGIWDEDGKLLSWKDTEYFANELGLPTVPVLYDGDNFNTAINAWKSQKDSTTSEGFVIRDAESFSQELFGERMAKWVRPNHVTTSSDWRSRDDYARNGISPK